MVIPTRLKRLALGLLVLAAAVQFYRPARTNPPVDPGRTVVAATALPAEVAAILRRSCFDCHSNETRWPWYSAVVPMAWGVANHVAEGRATMNFSEWGAYAPRKRVAMLEKMCDEVREEKMPLPSYLLLHPGARLAEADWQAICDWSMDEADRLAVSTSAKPSTALVLVSSHEPF
jgi:hypothetical protein